MSTLTEIERASEALPPREVEALAVWLEGRRPRREAVLPAEEWLERARGTAGPEVTTESTVTIIAP